MPQFTLYLHGLTEGEARETAYEHITLMMEGFKDGKPQPDNLDQVKSRFTVIEVTRANDPGTYYVRVHGGLSDVAQFLRGEKNTNVKRTI